MRVVIDTNVLVAAMRSKNGASNALIFKIGLGYFEIALSVPLMFEYEDVLSRPELGFEQHKIDAVLNFIAANSHHQKIHYLWRPHLNDPKDDMVLELALNANCNTIVTFNQKDFRTSNQLGVQTIFPKDFLHLIGGQS
jgi:putative PIN family toxin of toxin-antitoxin system